MKIYNSIVKIADERNMSLAEIEHRAGLPEGTISKWKRRKPPTEGLLRVADVLGVGITVVIPFDYNRIRGKRERRE